MALSVQSKIHPSLQTLYRRKESCRCGYPIKPIRKGSHQILYRILETKAPIQFISYLSGIKGKSFLYSKAMQVAKREGITADNIEWFVNMVNIGTYNIPDLQKQYAKLQDEVQVIDHQKVVSKAELDNMNNQISILRRTMYQLSATCNSKRNEISYLKNQIQVLEGYVNGLKSRNQQTTRKFKTNPIPEWSVCLYK